jgi:hypothetical protein
MKQYSLTVRLAVLFGLLSFTLLALIGLSIYGGLKRQLTVHEETRFIARVERVRALLEDPHCWKIPRSLSLRWSDRKCCRTSLATTPF